MRAALLLLPLSLSTLNAQSKPKPAPKPEPKAEAPAAKTEAPAQRPIRWDGEYSLMDGSSADLATAIPDHVKDLNFALKAFWKRKIEKACVRETAISVLSGTNLSLTLGKELPVVVQGDGSPVSWKRADGEAFQVRMAREGSKITLTFEGDGFTLRRVLAMDEEGGGFALHTTYQNPKCPAGDFTFKALYRRRS